jgi:hypothetical protein
MHTCIGKRRLRRFEEPLALKLLWGGANTTYILSLEVRDKRVPTWDWWRLLAAF